jgi:SAM-dependent methyltransferase
MDPHVAANRALWDEWTPIHVRSAFYDVDGWKSGRRHDLLPLLVDEVGDVAGKDLLHLQCHFGLDTLSWARRGARVTGADFSERAVQQARLLAAETGLEARFVVSDVVDLPDRLEGDFDVVFTSFGVLDRLPDVPRWAEVVAHFVRPGRLLPHRRGPPVRLGLRRRRGRDRAAPPLPLLAVAGAAEVPEHRVLRRPGRPGRGRAWDLAAPEPDDARLPLLYSLKATKA